MFAAHPLIGIERQADDLIDAPLRASLLETVWEGHRLPGAPVMLALLDQLAA